MNRKNAFSFSTAATTILLCALTLGAGSAGSREASPQYDFVITGARIVDGTGAPWFYGDVAIRGDRIAAIGDLHKAPARKRIDAQGLTVTPGFIDLQGQSEFYALVDNRVASKIMQGVTTEITGEGTSIAPVNDRMVKEGEDEDKKYGVNADWRTLDEYFAHFARSKSTINLGTFVGAGGVRNYVIGENNRSVTPAEMEQMKQVVAQAMEQGAFGVSSALEYVPDVFASTDELVELAKVAHRYGGVYFTHQRSESDRIAESLDEVFAISERAQIPTTIWHLKAAYSENFGKMPMVLQKIAEARARGVDVAASVYPFTRASNGLIACFPSWVAEGGNDKLVARLQDPAQRARIKQEMDEQTNAWENEWRGSGGAPGVQLISVVNAELAKYEGLTFEEIAKAMGKDPRDAAMDIAIADHGNSQVVIAIMDENDVKLAVENPLVSFGSDSPGQAEDGPLSKTKAHPRAFGTFPRVLAKYVRDEHGMRMEEAVRKMTSLAASRVGLWDRGILRPGMMADVTVFDDSTIQDKGSFTDPLHYAAGVKEVFVNGRPVVLDGKMTDERPGRGLRGPGYVGDAAKK